MSNARGIVFSLLTIAAIAAPALAAEKQVAFEQGDGRLKITLSGEPFAEYVWRDDKILRPYFTRVYAPGGIQVTRNHPPVAGQDTTDHDTMHPGIWLAFGDIRGEDFWRNKGRVVHEKFVKAPNSGGDRGSFMVKNHYIAAGGETICSEVCHVVVIARPRGVLMLLDSGFSPLEDDLYFGDQEEMGLGVRLATPLAVNQGGRIANSNGQTNEAAVWGEQADWCDYSGIVAGRRAGIVLMADPRNFGRSWFHARDYGLLVANPFGRNAFTRGEKSRVVVAPGETLRLRYGVFVYATDSKSAIDPGAAYADYLKLIGQDN